MTEQQEQMIYDEGRRRGFCDGYEACRNYLAEKMMERIEEDGTLVVGVKDATKVTRVLVEDDKKNGDLYYADRPKGEWVEEGCASGSEMCNQCRFVQFKGRTHNFCPYCGADMRQTEK